ncbi:aspartate kinase, partial [Devosia limi DSM 17137]
RVRTYGGVSVALVDLSGCLDERQLPLDEVIGRAFADIDLSRELPIVTGYAQCRAVLMGTYDRGYSEVVLSRVAVVTEAREAIIHKEFHLSSADPRAVGLESVRVLRETNYYVAAQLSDMGMEAIHPRAATSPRQARIPLRVKYAFEPAPYGPVLRTSNPPAA